MYIYELSSRMMKANTLINQWNQKHCWMTKQSNTCIYYLQAMFTSIILILSIQWLYFDVILKWFIYWNRKYIKSSSIFHTVLSQKCYSYCSTKKQTLISNNKYANTHTHTKLQSTYHSFCLLSSVEYHRKPPLCLNSSQYAYNEYKTEN